VVLQVGGDKHKHVLKHVCLCSTNYSICAVPGAQAASLCGRAILSKPRGSKECQTERGKTADKRQAKSKASTAMHSCCSKL